MENIQVTPRQYHFSQNGINWITTQTNSREPLTMEYRKGECRELPYYCVERKKYYRFCREHIAEPVTSEAGERAHSEEEIGKIIDEFFPSYLAGAQCDLTKEQIDGFEGMAKEILRLRDVVKNLEEAIADE